jgi:hypothetical protein
VAIGVAMPFVARSRRPHADATFFDEHGSFRGGTMRMPMSILLLSIVGLLFFWGIAILSIVYPDSDKQNPLIPLAFLGFSLLGVVLLKQYFIDRIYLDPRTLTSKGLIRHRTIRWDEISSIRYSQPAQWFRIEAQDRRVTRVSTMLSGLQDFANVVLAKVPPERIDPRARILLEKSRRGELPVVRR